MPSLADLKTSKFITRKDVTKPILVTIRGYDLVNVAAEGATPDEKYVLHFNEHEKPLVLNVTNGQIIAKSTGSEDFDGWIGKQIVLYDDPNVSFGGKLVGGVRVRAPKAQAAPQQPQQRPAPVAPAPVQAPAPAFDDSDPDSVPF